MNGRNKPKIRYRLRYVRSNKWEEELLSLLLVIISIIVIIGTSCIELFEKFVAFLIAKFIFERNVYNWIKCYSWLNIGRNKRNKTSEIRVSYTKLLIFNLERWYNNRWKTGRVFIRDTNKLRVLSNTQKAGYQWQIKRNQLELLLLLLSWSDYADYVRMHRIS